MFAQERANILELIEWNSLPRVPNKNESIRVIECWKYENNNSPVQGVNYRLLTLADQARERSVISNGVDDRLEEWLQWKVSKQFRILKLCATSYWWSTLRSRV